MNYCWDVYISDYVNSIKSNSSGNVTNKKVINFIHYNQKHCVNISNFISYAVNVSIQENLSVL